MASASCYPKASAKEPSGQGLQRSNTIASDGANWIGQGALFRNLSAPDIAEVAAAAKKRNFPARQPIFCEDDTVCFVFVLTSGRVKARQFSRGGKEVILRI